MAKKSLKNVAAVSVTAVDAANVNETATLEVTVTENTAETAPVAPVAAAAAEPAKLTKRAIAIQIMNDNADKPMAAVCALMETGVPLTPGGARAYYRGLVADGVAKGTPEKIVRQPGEKAERAPKPDSKRAKAIAVMVANADKPMGEVVAMIAAAVPLDLGRAKAYYRGLASEGSAPGLVVKEARAKAEKPAKAAKKAEEKPILSPAELAKLKAANLAKMKQVHAAKGKTVADDHPETLSADEVKELV